MVLEGELYKEDCRGPAHSSSLWVPWAVSTRWPVSCTQDQALTWTTLHVRSAFADPKLDPPGDEPGSCHQLLSVVLFACCGAAPLLLRMLPMPASYPAWLPSPPPWRSIQHLLLPGSQLRPSPASHRHHAAWRLGCAQAFPRNHPWLRADLQTLQENAASLRIRSHSCFPKLLTLSLQCMKQQERVLLEKQADKKLWLLVDSPVLMWVELVNFLSNRLCL